MVPMTVNLTQVQNMISGIGGGAQSKVTEGDNIKVTESPDTATMVKYLMLHLKTPSLLQM